MAIIDFPQNPQVNETVTVANVTWTWDGVAWSIISTVAGGGQVGSGISEINADSGSITGETSITLAGGTDIETSATGSTLTVNYTGSGGGGGGGGGASNLGDLNDVNISGVQENEVLKYVAGEWTNATDATGDGGGGGGGANNYADLGDIPSGHTPDEFYESAIVTFRVNNTGASAYTFAPHYSGDNPTIFVLSGTTVAFDLSQISGHPFLIQDSTGINITSGLVHVGTDGTVSTDTNAQGQTGGTLYWRIPEATASPPNYRYQCQSHSAMVGPITIKDFSAI